MVHYSYNGDVKEISINWTRESIQSIGKWTFRQGLIGRLPDYEDINIAMKEVHKNYDPDMGITWDTFEDMLIKIIGK